MAWLRARPANVGEHRPHAGCGASCWTARSLGPPLGGRRRATARRCGWCPVSARHARPTGSGSTADAPRRGPSSRTTTRSRTRRAIHVGELVHLACLGLSRGKLRRASERSRRATRVFTLEPYRGLATGYVPTQSRRAPLPQRDGRLRGVRGGGGEPRRRRGHDRGDRRARSRAGTTAPEQLPGAGCGGSTRRCAPKSRPSPRLIALSPLARGAPRLLHSGAPQLPTDHEVLPLAGQDRAGQEVPREEDARDGDPRLEHHVPELPGALRIVRERAEVVHPHHPSRGPSRSRISCDSSRSGRARA